MKGLHPDQYGFRPGRSTEDGVNSLIEGIERSEAKYVVVIDIDIAGAFDNLWWPALFGELRDMDCPADLYSLLKNYCQDRYVLMRYPNETISKHIIKGCPQGSIVGPIFWDIIMDKLLKSMGEEESVHSALAYADDLAVVVEGDSRRTIERSACNAMRALSKWCQENKLATNKTHYALAKGLLARDPAMVLNGESVLRKEINRYLGVHLDERYKFPQPRRKCMCQGCAANTQDSEHGQ